MGNPQFAVPGLQQIAESDHKVIAVVSNPPKRIGRGKKIRETAVGVAAKALEIPLLQPSKLNDLNFLRYLSWMKPDIFVVVAFKILSKKILAIPKYGAVNLHPSLLPKYRGAAPIQWALINGDTETAVTTISLTSQIDAGSILLQETANIKDTDNYGSLSDRLSKQGADLLVRTLDGMESGNIKGYSQDKSKVTKAPKLTQKDYRIDWTTSSIEILNRIRAFSPFTGAFTFLNDKRLKIFSALIAQEPSNLTNPGEIYLKDNKQIFVKTVDRTIEILELQIEGKRRMKAEEFLKGIKLESKSFI